MAYGIIRPDSHTLSGDWNEGNNPANAYDGDAATSSTGTAVFDDSAFAELKLSRTTAQTGQVGLELRLDWSGAISGSLKTIKLSVGSEGGSEILVLQRTAGFSRATEFFRVFKTFPLPVSGALYMKIRAQTNTGVGSVSVTVYEAAFVFHNRGEVFRPEG